MPGQHRSGAALGSPVWDGTWRIVAFDIPEVDAALRARLRRKLHEHRFGWLQNSVWITPDPVDEFRALLSEKRLLPDSLSLLEARPAGGESNEAMVAAAWDFVALAKSHDHYLKILQLYPNRMQPAGCVARLARDRASSVDAPHPDGSVPPPIFAPARLPRADDLGRTSRSPCGLLRLRALSTPPRPAPHAKSIANPKTQIRVPIATWICVFETDREFPPPRGKYAKV